MPAGATIVAAGTLPAMDAWTSGAPAGVPHEGQKRASDGSEVPQLVQARSSRAPHWAQKRWPG
jgi:hypothetical protein